MMIYNAIAFVFLKQKPPFMFHMLKVGIFSPFCSNALLYVYTLPEFPFLEKLDAILLFGTELSMQVFSEPFNLFQNGRTVSENKQREENRFVMLA